MDRKRVETITKIVAIVAMFIASFVLPLWLIPIIEVRATLTSFQEDLIQAALATTPTFVGLVLTFLYHNVDRFHLFVRRSIMKITRGSVSWSLSVKYDGASKDSVEKIFKDILDKYDDAESLQNNPIEKLVNLPTSLGGVVRIAYYDSDELINDTGYLLVKLFDINVPFDKSEKVLQQIDWLLSNLVEKHTSRGAKYTFRVNFGDHNPYFGLYVRKENVSPNEVLGFNCEFIDRQGQSEGRVDVSEKRLALVTDNLADFRLLSKRYVSLASLDAPAS